MFGIITNPAVIKGVLSVLAAKYTISELKNFKEMLSVISEAKSNSEGYSQIHTNLSRQNHENENKTQEREDILYPTMKDKNQNDNKDIFSDFLAAETQQAKHSLAQNSALCQMAVDHIDNPALKKIAIENFGFETAENLLMSKKDYYLNTDYAKEHLIFKNYKELSTDLRNYFEKKITSQIGADKLESTGGIYIDAQHESSKKLSKALINNQEFIQKYEQAKKLIVTGNSVNTSIQFTDNNFHYAIGKADILDMHINRNGDLDLLVTDVYDFNDDKNASALIKAGRKSQEKGEIIPYFYIYHVIIPKNTKLNGNKIK